MVEKSENLREPEVLAAGCPWACDHDAYRSQARKSLSGAADYEICQVIEQYYQGYSRDCVAEVAAEIYSNRHNFSLNLYPRPSGPN